MKKYLRSSIYILFMITAFLFTGCGEENKEKKKDLGSEFIPANVSATSSLGEIIVSWDAVSGADSYNLYWAGTSGVTTMAGTLVAGVTSPHTMGGLANGTARFFIVVAVFAGTEDAPSTEATAIVPYDALTSEPTTNDATLSASDFTQGVRFTPSETIVLIALRYAYGDDLVIYEGTGQTLIYSATVNVVAPSATWYQHDLPAPITLTGGTEYYIGNYVADITQYLGGIPAIYSFAHGIVDATQEYWAAGRTFPSSTDIKYWSYINPVYTLP